MADRSFTQEFDLEQAVEAHALFSRVAHSDSKPRATFVVMFVVLLLLAIGITGASNLATKWWLVWLPLCGALSWFIVWPPKAWLKIGMKRQILAFREQTGTKSAFTTYHFNDERLRVEAETSSETIAWSDLYGWYESEGLFLLYRAPKSYYFVNKTQLEVSLAESLRRSLLAYSGKPFRGR